MRCFYGMSSIVTLIVILALSASCIGSRAADEVFFGNLHSHTSYSDGVSTPDVAYAHARDVAHVDFLAITEHNHLTGATRIGSHPELYSGAIPTSLISTAGRFNNDGHFVAIYGQEFSSIESGNHANVFEVGEVIRSVDVPSGQWNTLFNTWLPTHLDSTGQPAIMLLNHPATTDSPNSVEYGIDDFANLGSWLAALDKHVALINIINGPSHAGETGPGRPSESEFLRYLAIGLHVAPTADQDNHQPNWGDAARPRTAIIAPSLTKANILAAMRSRHVYASQDPNLKIIATVNGRLMGTRFQGTDVPTPNAMLNISVKISDVAPRIRTMEHVTQMEQFGGPGEVAEPRWDRDSEDGLRIKGTANAFQPFTQAKLLRWIYASSRRLLGIVIEADAIHLCSDK